MGHGATRQNADCACPARRFLHSPGAITITAMATPASSHPSLTAAHATATDAAAEATQLPSEPGSAAARSAPGIQGGDVLYLQLFDSLPLPAFILASDGFVIDVNPAATALFQQTRAQARGQPLPQLLQGLSAAQHEELLQALRQGQAYFMQAPGQRSLALYAAPLPYPMAMLQAASHTPPHWLVLAHRLHSHSSDHYAELFEAIDQGVVVYDAQGALQHINDAAMRILNHAPGDDSWRAAFHSNSWTTVDAHGMHLPREQTPAAIVQRSGKPVLNRIMGLYQVHARHFRWLQVSAIPRFANTARPGDAPVQVVSLIRDITESRRDQHLFSRLQALSTAGAWEWERGSDRCFLTQGALRILRLEQPPASLAGLLACFMPPDSQRLRQALEQALATQTAFTLELRPHPQPNEPEHWVRLQGEPDMLDPFSIRISGTLEDISRSKHMEQNLLHKARTDPLTGLLNRDALLEELHRRLLGKSPLLALLYVDLNRFKVINDALGHYIGDQLLRAVAQRLRSAAGEQALCARMGGDEFVFLCPTAEPGMPIALAQRILAQLSEPFQIEQESIRISASIGIALAPRDGRDSDTLLQNADAAMYESKRRGHGSWHLYSEDLARRQHDRLQMDNLMRSAIDKGELQLLYQPQVHLQSGTLIGAEALLRWHSPELGEVPPETFIAHAEHNGEIMRLGAWALNEACQQVRRWRNAGLNTVPIAVNVSYRQFLAGDLAHIVVQALQQAHLPGAALELEFTERVLIEDEPLTTRTISHLRTLGVRLSIDDFGEGYSALNYLRRLPIHGLKLSRLFLQGAPYNASDAAICQAVAAIAQGLGLGLVAEGVERITQRDFLQSLGVAYGQGYLFSPPLSAETFAQWLKQPQFSSHRPEP
ncbi:PAS domain S-box protein [Vandammella animalimorsus]|uniref:PAS domain S-box protein n=2 Tax=Vandammella animalimorsus TaxID=2029117 RepID=A0A2A2AQ27_9BURK|nr:PAS domain S-box protein [Vandammella animalimorsus]